MLWEAEFCMLFLMAIETRLRIPPWIVDEHILSSTRLYVLAAGPVTGFATTHTMIALFLFEKP